MHNFVFYIHIFTSIVYLVLAIWLIFIHIKGILNKQKYTKMHKFIAISYILSLYLQLIIGLFLFFSQEYESLVTPPHAIDGTIRFWSIEHVFLMIFALAIAQIGYINTVHAESFQVKFKKGLVFYSIPLLLILISLGIIYFQEI